MNLQEQKIKRLSEEGIKNLSNDELMEYLEEQSKLPRNKRHLQKDIAKILGIGERTLRRQLSDYRNEGKAIEKYLTEHEIEVIKEIVEKYENNFFNFSDEINLDKFQIYNDLEKVKIGEDPIRSAFNLSKETTEKLKTFSNVRRIQLQDLVELFVINGLEKYDK
jgi:ribosomal protein S13